MTVEPTAKQVLLVEDEPGFREVLEIGLESKGFQTEGAASLAEALQRLEGARYDAIVSDLRLKDGSGLELLEWLKARQDTTPVLIMTAYATTETTVQALNLGAVDFLTKAKNDIEEVAKVLKGLFAATPPPSLEVHDMGDLVGVGDTMRRLQAMVGKFARADTTVLITGESGTGKEIVARLIHRYSDRAKGPFVPVNCGALPDELLESELFGYEKGAFTGAGAAKKGLFEESNQGVLFLDEIGEMPLHLQVKLLRVLQERKVRRIGSSDERVVDVRVIVATNRNIKERVEKRWFREDLYYRLNILHIDIPPLRDRLEDLPVLIEHFVAKFCRKLHRPPLQIQADALEILNGYRFPGNVRELENLMERCVALASGPTISVDLLPEQVVREARNPQGAVPALQQDCEIPGDGFDLEAYMTAVKGYYFREALEICGGNRTRAARLLGMSFRAFRYWLQQLGGQESLPEAMPSPRAYPASPTEEAPEEA